MRASSGRAIATSTHLADPAGVGSELADSALPGQEVDSLLEPVGIRGQRFRQRLDLLGRPARIASIVRGKQRGVGLGVRDTEDTDRGLAENVMESEAGSVDRDRTEQGTEGKGRAVALLGQLIERTRDQFRPTEGGLARERIGERCEERVGSVSERVHRSGPELELRGARHRIGIGEHQGGPVETRDLRFAARGQTVEAGDRRAGERRRDGRHLSAGDRRDRLRRIDHAATAEGDQTVGWGLVD